MLRRAFGTNAAGSRSARALLGDAVALLRRAWAIHFEFMYPLVEGYAALLALARDLGLDDRLVPRLLQDYPTRITETDAAVWRVAATVAREGAADELEVDAVRRRFGDRTDDVYEVSQASWRDDAAPILQRASRLAPRVAAGTRQEKIEASAANFAWWNEEHNAYIDLRAHIPLGRAARLLATELGIADREQVFFLFLEELEQLASGRGDLEASLALAEERAVLYERGKATRSELPTIVGRAPEQLADPIMDEIFGITAAHRRHSDNGREPTVLRGTAAAPGQAAGRARVARGPDALAAIEAGDTTAIIPTGAMVEVDGTEGVVVIGGAASRR